MKDRVPDKDILGSPLRFEDLRMRDLRMRGGVDGLMLDSAYGR